MSFSSPAPQSSRAAFKCPDRDDMIKAVSSLHCLVLVGASSPEQSGHSQVPGSRRHDRGCVIIALPCLCLRQLQRAVGPPPGACIDDMIKAVSSLHCLVFVGASSKEQSGHLQVPGSRRTDQGCVIILHCLVFVGASSKVVGLPPGVRIDVMIKAVSSSCTALSLSSPAPQNSRATFRCPDRDDMIEAVSSLSSVFIGASRTEQSGHRQVPGLTT